MAQMLKSPPAMQETWAPSLGWEDTLEEGMAVFLPGEFHGQNSLVGYSSWSHKDLGMTEQLRHMMKSQCFISETVSMLQL